MDSCDVYVKRFNVLKYKFEPHAEATDDVHEDKVSAESTVTSTLVTSFHFRNEYLGQR